jgi:hypothetical protein
MFYGRSCLAFTARAYVLVRLLDKALPLYRPKADIEAGRNQLGF